MFQIREDTLCSVSCVHWASKGIITHPVSIYLPDRPLLGATSNTNPNLISITYRYVSKDYSNRLHVNFTFERCPVPLPEQQIEDLLEDSKDIPSSDEEDIFKEYEIVSFLNSNGYLAPVESKDWRYDATGDISPCDSFTLDESSEKFLDPLSNCSITAGYGCYGHSVIKNSDLNESINIRYDRNMPFWPCLSVPMLDLEVRPPRYGTFGHVEDEILFDYDSQHNDKVTVDDYDNDRARDIGKISRWTNTLTSIEFATCRSGHPFDPSLVHDVRTFDAGKWYRVDFYITKTNLEVDVVDCIGPAG